MKVKRILITGDDGYNSLGIRLLVRFLKDKYDLNIAATLGQMSGVGGHLSLRTGGEWGEDNLDGVPVMWVSGYPCDAMECAVGYYRKKFDLVISGINWGMNIGGAVISSGTFSAGIRALNLGLAPRALILSWMLPPEYWYNKHDSSGSIDKYLIYPGQTAARVIDLSIINDLWGAELLNINFPEHKSDRLKFTTHLPDLKKFFSYPIIMDRENHKFRYPGDDVKTETKGQPEFDTGAILSGFISITPHNAYTTNYGLWESLKDKDIKLGEK